MSAWTDRYAAWKGSFADLIATANAILRAHYPGSEAVTERTARHYQQVGALSKGSKTGRSAEFTADDLAALVNTKAMAKDLGLKMVSTLSQTYAPSTVTANYLAASATSASVSSDPSATAPNAAMAAVAQLMSQTPDLDPKPAWVPGSVAHFPVLSMDNLHAAAAQATVNARSLKGMRGSLEGALTRSAPMFAHHSPASWLTVAVDELAAQAAPAPERARAAAFLADLAARLTQE